MADDPTVRFVVKRNFTTGETRTVAVTWASPRPAQQAPARSAQQVQSDEHNRAVTAASLRRHLEQAEAERAIRSRRVTAAKIKKDTAALLATPLPPACGETGCSSPQSFHGWCRPHLLALLKLRRDQPGNGVKFRPFAAGDFPLGEMSEVQVFAVYLTPVFATYRQCIQRINAADPERQHPEVKTDRASR